MTTHTHSKERRILVVMRKVLAQIVKDTTPQPGRRHALNDNTIQDIRACFALISARERELAEEVGINLSERPQYADEAHSNKVVKMHRIDNPRKPEE